MKVELPLQATERVVLCLVPASVQGTLRGTQEGKKIYNILKFSTIVMACRLLLKFLFG
jgi:hypothetical protein